MTNRELTARVSALVQPLCQEADVSLWDVTFEKEGRQHVLTVYIDRPEGVSITHCEQVSRGLDPLLDSGEFDSLPPYTLSVSSAGLERPLIRPEHFRWGEGKLVRLSFYKALDGADSRTGRLISNDGVQITLQEGEQVCRYPMASVARVRLCLEQT